MDEYVYRAIEHYYTALRALGRYSRVHVGRLLILMFYRRLLYEDYRGYVSREDYALIGSALERLYGSTCLIPYADYLKMGKLRMGDMAELMSRTRALERENMEMRGLIGVGAALIEDAVRRVDDLKATPDDIADAVVIKDKNYLVAIPDIDVSGIDEIEGR